MASNSDIYSLFGIAQLDLLTQSLIRTAFKVWSGAAVILTLNQGVDLLPSSFMQLLVGFSSSRGLIKGYPSSSSHEPLQREDHNMATDFLRPRKLAELVGVERGIRIRQKSLSFITSSHQPYSLHQKIFTRDCAHTQGQAVFAESLSCVQLFETLRTVAHQAPLSMGIFQARMLEWVALTQGIFPSQGSNPSLHCRQTLLCLSHQEIQGEDIIKKCDYEDTGSLPAIVEEVYHITQMELK